MCVYIEEYIYNVYTLYWYPTPPKKKTIYIYTALEIWPSQFKMKRAASTRDISSAVV